MLPDVEAEKKEFCATAEIDSITYASDYQIGRRTRRIFGTFARVLGGRSKLSKEKKEAEMGNLLQVVRQKVVLPILHSPAAVLASQAQFDEWHRDKSELLKRQCPISWKSGSHLTVGLCQKLINLHCKDIWALNLVDSRYSVHFHAIIDQITLGIIHKRGRMAWTKLDSYEAYMQLQSELREVSERRGTYPLAIESKNWNEYTAARPRRVG